jgi:membrane-associated protein
MEHLHALVDVFLHLDRHLHEVIVRYGEWTHALLFVIVFCETGLVVTPFLPGDSLLFAAGTFAARGSLDLGLTCVLLSVAAIAGDSLNYAIGKRVGSGIFERERIRFVKKAHLERTRAFYARYGAKTIVLARFVPIVRTFAPFVAGIGTMRYRTFLVYNVLGGVLWVATCVLAGYFFGNIPVVQENFSLVILAIVFVSILPGVFEFLRHRRELRAAASGG